MFWEGSTIPVNLVASDDYDQLGDYDFSDYTEDFGEFNEVIEDIEEEVFTDTQLSLAI